MTDFVMTVMTFFWPMTPSIVNSVKIVYLLDKDRFYAQLLA